MIVYIVHTHWNLDIFSEKCGRGITLDRVDTQMQFWVIKSFANNTGRIDFQVFLVS